MAKANVLWYLTDCATGFGLKENANFPSRTALQTSSLTHFFINLNVFCITYMSGKSQNYKHQSVRLEIVSLREPEF
jgi:hypothetical protein